MQYVKIITEVGRELVLESKSKIYSPDSISDEKFREVQALLPGNIIGFNHSFSFVRNPNILCHDTSWILGLLVGDGSYNSIKKGYRVDLTNIPSENGEQYFNLIKSKFNLECKKIIKKSKAFTYYFINKDVRMHLFDLGLKFQSKSNKEVPFSIFLSDKESIVNFFSGLIDSDGHINKQNLLLISISKKIVLQVQLLLSSIGISSYIKKSICGRFYHYTLHLFSTDSRNYLSLYSGYLRSVGKYKHLNHLMTKVSINATKKSIPDLFISDEESRRIYSEVQAKYPFHNGRIKLRKNISHYFRDFPREFTICKLRHVLSQVDISNTGKMCDLLIDLSLSNKFYERIKSVEKCDSLAPTYNTVPIVSSSSYDFSDTSSNLFDLKTDYFNF